MAEAAQQLTLSALVFGAAGLVATFLVVRAANRA